MIERETLKKVNAIINHSLSMYEKRSRRAYETQTPTYFMGCFEAAYQFAYAVIDCYNIQDAIDFLNDDIRYYEDERNDSYYNGYVHVAKKIVRTLRDIEFQYWYDYGISRVWSLVDFNDIANAIN